jgi:hypothetical protein
LGGFITNPDLDIDVMSEVDTQKVGLGALLLVVSSVLILGSSSDLLSSALPTAVLALGALGLAAGSLLLGTSESGRPV